MFFWLTISFSLNIKHNMAFKLARRHCDIEENINANAPRQVIRVYIKKHKW